MSQLRLICALRGSYGMTAYDLARLLDIPRASVRRLVSELRAYGVCIETNHGFYLLHWS